MGRKRKICDLDLEKVVQLYKYGFGLTSISYIIPYQVSPEAILRLLRLKGVQTRKRSECGRYVRRAEVLDAMINWTLPITELAKIYPENGKFDPNNEYNDAIT